MGLITCSETVRLDDAAKDVEFIEQAAFSTFEGRCAEVATFEVQSTPKELSGEERHDVLEIKAKNQARKKGATHVMVGPSEEWPCDKDGSDNPESERTCAKADANAYECVIGSRPF